ncbi:autotransporter assembly complex protein TamA [Oceaniglobus trochenteri]|uniref:autotransporter assembly complex protein TamA n=1 Tax=Oceaniglobus trochenteri TaxID=2763260 RepID=UPI001CFFBDAF|nr:autotransporter assembly complex family protein [Oceaniglobus trochenteri]
MAVLGLWMTPVSALENLEFRTPGADEALADELRQSSLLIAAQNEGNNDPQELLAAANADYGRLVGTLYSEGRFGGVINIMVDGREAAGIPPLSAPDAIRTIVVTVKPGPQYNFSRTEIVPQAPGTVLPDGFAPGQPARTPVIRDSVAAVVDGWRDVGRAKASVAGQKVTANHNVKQLAVDVGIAPGPEVRFGDLLLKGGDRVRPARLRKIAGLPTGEIYSPEALELSAKRLRRTGTFKSVSLTEAETLRPGDVMDITATLTEEKPRRIGFGAEISTVEGLALSAFWLHRNLLGGAERLRLEGNVTGIGGDTGGTDYKFSARYGRPATPDADTDLYILAEVEQVNEPTYSAKTGRLGFGFDRYINDQLSVSLGLAYVYSQDTDALGTLSYHHLTLPLNATYDSRDMPLDATKGYFADVDVMPFLGVSGSESGARVAFDTRAYKAFGDEGKFVLAGRVQGGSIIGASLTGVPNDYRFYSGGGGTVRGQAYQSLGVMVNGELTGGRSFLGLSGELRAKVRESIGVVAFADFGLVGADSFGGDADTHAGAGLGLRYLTPIGPIRLDVAAPIGGTSSGAQVYVGIGQAF